MRTPCCTCTVPATPSTCCTRRARSQSSTRDGRSSRSCRWRELARRDGIPIFVTGAAGDATIADAIAERAGRGVIAVAGATSIGAFGALAGRARAVIAVDSGPMHVAAAVGAPTVGIFALQSDEPDRWAPQGRRVAIVRPAYPCPPWHRKETCPDFACVRELDATRIVATLDGLLGAPAEP
jgi:ADP-heptose:LPS heptosyltransferase